MFNTIAYLAPILLVGVLVLGSRLPLLYAGGAGLLATLLAATLTPLDYWPLVWAETLKGAWLALLSGAMVLGGLIFHHTLGSNRASNDAASRRPHLHAFVLCFIAAPVVESAIGFGVGFAVAIGGLLRLGIPPLRAAVLSLASQMLVPWGALGIGTLIGASLVHLPLPAFGFHSAMVIAPSLLVMLAWFWHGMELSGISGNRRDKLSELALLLALIGLLIAANYAGIVDAAGLLATAPLLALLHWRDVLADRVAWRLVLPYGLLLALLLFTRLIPEIATTLQSLLVWQPLPDMPAFPLLYYAGTLLLLAALITLVMQGGLPRLPTIVAQSWRGGRLSIGATLLFLIMARLYAGSGMAAELAAQWNGFAGTLAPLGTPVFSGLAGLLTGSNTASNSLMLPIQVALAEQSGMPVLWLAGLQNTTGSLINSLFPGKLALACAFAAIPGQERAVLRASLGYGGLMLASAMLVALLILLLNA
ncbi:L-lactate permease [Ferrovibrio sp.]|uniref:L-lactate permease n=1 Tax=Ferrovibrio sp. TaxID=1917215 RepID=UPI003D12E9E1